LNDKLDDIYLQNIKQEFPDKKFELKDLKSEKDYIDKREAQIFNLTNEIGTGEYLKGYESSGAKQAYAEDMNKVLKLQKKNLTKLKIKKNRKNSHKTLKL